MTKERRQFSRVAFQSQCFIILGNKKIAGALDDISIKGALVYVEAETGVKSHDDCIFELNLTGTDITIHIEAKAVYVKDNHYGLKFGNMELESMTHLRRLIELNIGDSNKVQQELFFLIGQGDK